MRFLNHRSLSTLAVASLSGSAIPAVLVAVTLAALSPGANAQWTVTDLGPGIARSVDGNQQGGANGIWSGTAASYIALGPFPSAVFGVGDGQQVGQALGGPALWSGSTASWVNLSPPGITASSGVIAFAVSGGQQVGNVVINFGPFQASLWHGTAASWVSLNPAGAGNSFALDTCGAFQVGWADGHAGLWSGTAASWVDLHPAGALVSQATGVDGGVQVGDARFGTEEHAGLWRGTAASWVDLHPAGATESSATSVSGCLQVGYVLSGGLTHAALWSGTASSFVDLHALVPPPGFSESRAYDIWSDGNTTYIVGEAFSIQFPNAPHAILWTHVGPLLSGTSYFVDGACGDDSWTGLSPVCQAPDGPKRTIQAAINNAADCGGDSVIVADGVYTGVGNKNLDFGGRNITVRSESGDPELCVIDCQGDGRGFYFHNAESASATVDGFTIRNGDSTGFPTFFLRRGGGILIDGSAPTIRNCIIENCVAPNDGGGLEVVDSNARIIGCRFYDNSADFGGALNLRRAANAQIINCAFIGNVAVWGGAIFSTQRSNPLIVNCTIVGNDATGGGGIYNNLGNGTTRVGNSILWGNNPDQIFDNGVVSEVTYTTVQQGFPGVGNISVVPWFVNPSNRNYRVFEGSPSNDAGNNTLVPASILTDLDGNSRFADDPSVPDTGVTGNGFSVVVDMGAYEFQPKGQPCPCACDFDTSTGIGVCDLVDFTTFAGLFATGDPCACDIDTSTGVGVCDLVDFTTFAGQFAGGCP